jgi:hypothetical protein
MDGFGVSLPIFLRPYYSRCENRNRVRCVVMRSSSAGAQSDSESVIGQVRDR